MADTGPEGTEQGLFGSFRRTAEALLALAQNRVRVFALELQSERVKLLDTLVWLAVGLGFAFVGLFLGALALAIYVWRIAGFAGLLAMMGLFFAAAAFILWRLRSELRKAPTPFADTLAEFRKDSECLQTRN